MGQIGEQNGGPADQPLLGAPSQGRSAFVITLPGSSDIPITHENVLEMLALGASRLYILDSLSYPGGTSFFSTGSHILLCEFWSSWSWFYMEAPGGGCVLGMHG